MNEDLRYTIPTCSYISPADGCKCQLPVWNESKEGYCLGHAREVIKPKAAFLKLLKTKFQRKDYSFDGFIFPYHLHLKNLVFKHSVTFIGCTFLQGLCLENLKFVDGFLSFEDAVFIGSWALFDRCCFRGKKTLFTKTVFDGEYCLFRNCEFAGDLADFSSIQWSAEKALAFAQCTFRSETTGFEGAQMNAPTVAFTKSTIASRRFELNKAEWQADQCLFNRIQQNHGVMHFQNSRFLCRQLRFSDSQFAGSAFNLHKCSWQGDELALNGCVAMTGLISLDHCGFKGKVIRLDGMKCERGRLQITHSLLSAEERLDFSSMVSESEITIRHCRLEAPQVLMNGVKTQGDGFTFQYNRVDGDHFSLNGSQFESTRVSFNRTRVRALETDISRSLFNNVHTSFQAVDFEGDRLTFEHSRFMAKKTLFNLTRFAVNRLNFDHVNFGTGLTSFWKTQFGKAKVSYQGSNDQGGQIFYSGNLSNHYFEGSSFSHCTFHDSTWNMVGTLRRVSTADEPELLKRLACVDLQKIYQWIAKQYERSGNLRMKKEFLYACQEVQRLELRREGELLDALKMEWLRWTTGYGLGVSQAGLIKGTAAICAVLIPLFTRMR